jgi:hypothetical protein
MSKRRHFWLKRRLFLAPLGSVLPHYMCPFARAKRALAGSLLHWKQFRELRRKWPGKVGAPGIAGVTGAALRYWILGLTPTLITSLPKPEPLTLTLTPTLTLSLQFRCAIKYTTTYYKARGTYSRNSRARLSVQRAKQPMRNYSNIPENLRERGIMININNFDLK